MQETDGEIGGVGGAASGEGQLGGVARAEFNTEAQRRRVTEKRVDEN